MGGTFPDTPCIIICIYIFFKVLGDFLQLLSGGISPSASPVTGGLTSSLTSSLSQRRLDITSGQGDIQAPKVISLFHYHPHLPILCHMDLPTLNSNLPLSAHLVLLRCHYITCFLVVFKARRGCIPGFRYVCYLFLTTRFKVDM